MCGASLVDPEQLVLSVPNWPIDLDHLEIIPNNVMPNSLWPA